MFVMSAVRPSTPAPRPRLRPLARLALVAALAAAPVVLLAGPASAHVHVDASTTEPGAYAQLTFRVPSESATASTTKVEVTLPSAQPFATVSARPLAGWTVAVTEAKLPTPVTDDDGATLTKAPHTVTWTAAADDAIPPGQFQEFDLLVGPLPESGTVVLPATQTYSNGDVVEWNQKPKADGSEPENPAPSFEVAAVATASPSPTPTSAAVPSSPTVTAAATTPPAASADATSTTDTTARVLAVVAIVVGVAGLGVGISSGRRRARS